MRPILVPYHLDERLEDLDAPVAATATITAELPDAPDPWRRMADLYGEVAGVVAEAVSSGDVPLVQSGDCTTSLGVVAGLQRAGIAPAIVWLDAHGDVQTPETSASGYLGGMPLRLLVGHRSELIADQLGLEPVAENDVVLVDARDLDPPEADYLAVSAIRRIEVSDLPDIVLPDRPIYLHVDVDVIDADDLPGLLYPAPGGPRLSEVAEALRTLVDRAEVAAVGLACTWQSGQDNGARLREVVSALGV